MTKLMIYGATGYTGTLAAQQAKATSVNTILASRPNSRLHLLARDLDSLYRSFSLTDPSTIDSNLQDIAVLLNCAGPFAATAEPLMQACIRTNTHYLDTSAELETYLLAEKYDAQARSAGVMLLPGCGGSVALFGCLVRRALQGLSTDNVRGVDLALHVAGPMSRGSAITAAAGMSSAVLQRQEGELITQEAVDTTQFDFGDGRGAVVCFPVTLPDLVTIHKFFGVPSIRTFANASEGAFPTDELSDMADGPTKEARDASPYHAAIKVVMADGSVRETAVRTVNGYTLVGEASVEAARRVMAGEMKPGFQTSATLFGAGFINGMA